MEFVVQIEVRSLKDDQMNNLKVSTMRSLKGHPAMALLKKETGNCWCLPVHRVLESVELCLRDGLEMEGHMAMTLGERLHA